MPAGHGGCQLLSQGAGEFQHLAAAEADQVMMVGGSLDLIVVMVLAQAHLIDQTQVAQQARGILWNGSEAGAAGAPGDTARLHRDALSAPG